MGFKRTFGTVDGDIIETGSENDIILARGGNDDISAGAGDDIVVAGAGDDRIRGGLGNDRLIGGTGFDTAVYAGSAKDFVFHTFGAGTPRAITRIVERAEDGTLVQSDLLVGIEAIEFEEDNFTYFLDGRNNVVLARDDTVMTDEDAVLTFAAATLLANDQDLDGDTINVTGVSATSVKGASVSFQNGQISYDQNGVFDALADGETATDSFTYTVDDGKGGVSTATVTVTIKGVNDAPVLTALNEVIVQENTTEVNAQIAATDVEGDTVTYSISGGADSSLFTIDPTTGALSFVDAPDFENAQDAGGDNVYEVEVTADDGKGGTATQAIKVTVADVDEAPAINARINEVHYDNAGGDVGEFIEVRTAAGDDISQLTVELYNGSNGTVYRTVQLVESFLVSATTDGTYDYYVIDLPENGIQNGQPDGIALSNGNTLIEFLSYEGTFTASGGSADGQTSTDIGVAESKTTPIGVSLQREEDGSWSPERAETKGADNTAPAIDPAPRLNEVHYDNAGADQNEFIEVRVTAGASVEGIAVELYNGSNGTRYSTVDLASADNVTKTEGGDGFDYYVINYPANGIQNGGPDGMALVRDGSVVEFLSYEGTFDATDGTAQGETSTDIGVEEARTTEVGKSLQRDASGTWQEVLDNTAGAANTEGSAPTARFNEVHYDNERSDVGEFVEIRTNAGDKVAGLLLELVNGSNGSVYDTVDLAADTRVTKTTDGTFDYYVVDFASNGLQNGGPDGFALSYNGTVLEFLSYEGTIQATAGAAQGQTSTDIGVSETNATPIGQSLQRGEGDSWDEARDNTKGAANTAAAGVLINELAVSTSGTDWEFVELKGTPGTSLEGYSLVQIGGAEDSAGTVLSVISLDGQQVGENGFFLAASQQAQDTFRVTPDLAFDNNTLQNDPSTFKLVKNFTGSVGDDLDANDDGKLDTTPYDSVVDEVALKDTSEPVLYSEVQVGPSGRFLPAGAARTDSGDFRITSFSDASDYSPTAGGANGNGGGDATERLISAIQGQGGDSPLLDQKVKVTAIVTYVDEDGYFIQEEDSDADGDANTSEGVFVFTGRGNTGGIEKGDQVEVVGTVGEFRGETQISPEGAAKVLSKNNAMPTAAVINISPDTTAADYEAVEGMRVSAVSGTDEALTVITNFQLGRYGQVTISAGNQVQATQVFDAQTQAAEVAQRIQDNANNRLILEDGKTATNVTEFKYIPVTAAEGDNGNGYLDAGDTFGEGGPTFRLGTQITSAVEGIMTFTGNDRFNPTPEYRLIVDKQLEIDEATNVGARTPAPADVGGELQVAAVNVENYFTTLSGGAGPNNLNPRGARTETDLERQTDKIVKQLLTTKAEVFALQELENGGFGETSAIDKLVDEMNAKVGSATYAFVNPTVGNANGFIGTDAITTGIVYDQTQVKVLYSDFLVYNEVSADVTAAIADPLNAIASAGDQVNDLQRSRPAVAAVFEDLDTGEVFTVVSVHFKSKGDSDLQDLADAAQAHLAGGGTTITQAQLDALLSDPNFDQGDGQGFWNKAREDAATETMDWVGGAFKAAASAAAGKDVGGNVLIMGDFNAYAQEDPTQAVRNSGKYADLLAGREADSYSFVFNGQRGALDQGFVSNEMSGFVTGVTEWHVNADEPSLLGYSSRFDDARFYSDDVYVAGDHDPMIVGLDFSANDTPLV